MFVFYVQAPRSQLVFRVVKARAFCWSSATLSEHLLPRLSMSVSRNAADLTASSMASTSTSR